MTLGGQIFGAEYVLQTNTMRVNDKRLTWIRIWSQNNGRLALGQVSIHHIRGFTTLVNDNVCNMILLIFLDSNNLQISAGTKHTTR